MKPPEAAGVCANGRLSQWKCRGGVSLSLSLPSLFFFTLAESAAFEGLVKPKASRCSIKQIKSVRQAAICPIQ